MNNKINNLFNKSILKPWWLWLCFYIFIFAWLLNHSFARLDNDYGWHLKFGQDILQTQQLPEAQIHMWTLAGQTWVDHEWLSNLLTAVLNNWGGYLLVNIFFALIIVILLVWLAIRAKKKYGHGDLFIIGWQLLGVFVLLGHLGIRIQEIGLIFFTIFLVLLNKFSDQKNLYKLSLIFLPLFWLWASCHASFVIGFIIIGLFLICRLIINKTKPGLDYLALIISPVVATLITPYGLKIYDLLFEYRNTAYMSMISEWLPVTAFPIHYFKLFFLAILLASIIYLWMMARQEIMNRRHLFIWALLTVLILFSLKSVRHFQLLFIASHIFLLPLLVKQSVANNKLLKSIWFKFIVIVFFLGLALWQLLKTNFVTKPYEYFQSSYPVGASVYLKNNPQLKNLKLLNDYDWGGFMIGVLPDWLLFIDGRLPQKMYQGKTMIENFTDFKIKDLLVQKLKDQQIELVLWKTKQQIYDLKMLDKFFGFTDAQINSPRNYLRYYLRSNPDWVKIYGDNVAEIYVLKRSYSH